MAPTATTTSEKECLRCKRKFDPSENSSRCPDCNDLLLTVRIDPLLGTILDGKYRIDHLLAAGGMGNIYKAVHEHLQTVVALKILPEVGGTTKDRVERFQQEATLASTLAHPNIGRIYNYGIAPRPYIVMEYIAGETLAALIRREGMIPPERALPIAIQIADAMAQAHSAGLVHRDLKPSNIMIEEPSGAAKIIDFGLVKEFLNDVKLTKTGETVGSPPYMSPEQCKGGVLDARSDIYSFGCLLYEALTGVSPFAAESIVASIYKHLETPAPSLKQAKKNVSFPKGLEKVVQNCLNKAPELRYQTMLALKDDLEAVLKGKPAKIKAFRKAPRAQRLAKLAPLASVGAMLLAGFVFLLPYLSTEEPIPPVVPNPNKLALGDLAKEKGTVSIKLTDPLCLNGMTKRQIFAMRQEQLDSYKSLVAAPYKPFGPVFDKVEDGQAWLSLKGLCYTRTDGPTILEGKSYESIWVVNPLLLASASFGEGPEWNELFIGDPENIKSFPYDPMPQDLKITPPKRLMEVTYDLDDYNEQVLEVNNAKAASQDTFLNRPFKVDLYHLNARDLGFNYFTVKIDGNKIIANQHTEPLQLAVSLNCRNFFFHHTWNNHVHGPGGRDVWFAPVKISTTCTEEVSLYRDKPASSTQKPDLTYLIHYKHENDGHEHNLDFLEKRAAQIVATDGADSTKLLSVYRRIGDAYLQNKNIDAALDSYGRALKIASDRRLERATHGILVEMSKDFPLNICGAQIDRVAKNQSWDRYTLSMARGAYCHRYHKHDLAISEFNNALSERPNSVTTYVWLASTLQKMGRYAEAISYYKQALKYDKDWQTCRDNIKECEAGDSGKHSNTGDAASHPSGSANLAVSNAAPFLNIAPRQKQQELYALQKRALSFFKSEHYGDAATKFQKVHRPGRLVFTAKHLHGYSRLSCRPFCSQRRGRSEIPR